MKDCKKRTFRSVSYGSVGIIQRTRSRKIVALAGAGGIEPCNNPLPHKVFSILAHPFDSIFDSKAKALVGMTDDEVAYIEAKGWKARVVPELSIIHQGWLVERGSRAI
jgi:hypothetical protein